MRESRQLAFVAYFSVEASGAASLVREGFTAGLGVQALTATSLGRDR